MSDRPRSTLTTATQAPFTTRKEDLLAAMLGQHTEHPLGPLAQALAGTDAPRFGPPQRRSTLRRYNDDDDLAAHAAIIEATVNGRW